MTPTKRNNYNSLTTFFDQEYGSLKRYVQSRISDSSDRDAEDIVQDVALRVFSRASNDTPIQNVAGFVYHSIRNRIIDLMRAGKNTTYPEDNLEMRWQEFVELFYSEADNRYASVLEEQLKTKIQALRPEYRDIIIAVDFEGYTYREIAEESGISQGTLMSRRHRALSILTKDLELERTKNKYNEY
ncbi:MAG: RNA polymerase sigma factor [Bacteroidota bacterium]